MNTRVMITEDLFSFVADRFVLSGAQGEVLGADAFNQLTIVQFDEFPCAIQVPNRFLKEIL